LSADKEEEGTKIEGEGSEGTSQNPIIQEDKYEQAAKKKGWAPQEEWRGDVEDWVPAKEFVGRQKLFDRIDDLKQALKRQKFESQQDAQNITKQLAEIRVDAYRKALIDLKAQKAVAKHDNDDAAVDLLEEEIDSTKKKLETVEAEAKVPVKQIPQESAEFINWKSDNKWFESNQEARDDAIAIGVGYAAKNPNLTEKQVYDYVTKKIQKIYPEEFENQNQSSGGKGKVNAISNVESGGGSSRSNPALGGKKGKSLSFSDLDEQTKQVAKSLIKRGAFVKDAAKNKRTQEEEFLFQYQANL
jgi:hypothetical protein